MFMFNALICFRVDLRQTLDLCSSVIIGLCYVEFGLCYVEIVWLCVFCRKFQVILAMPENVFGGSGAKGYNQFTQGGAPIVISWFIIPINYIEITPIHQPKREIGLICTNFAISNWGTTSASNEIAKLVQISPISTFGLMNGGYIYIVNGDYKPT